MTTSNYIVDQNRFSLQGPPTWWLQRLAEFDDSLVVIPSRQEFLYRLAQRRPPNLAQNIIKESLAQDRDAQMMASYGLIPVTTILATAKWDNPLMWKDLEERSPSRMGGADKYEALILANERQKQLQLLAKQDDINTQVARDAFKMYQIKLGTRLGLTGSTKNTAPRPTSRSAAIKILDASGKPTYRI